MTRYLLISIGLLLLVACGSYPKRQGFQIEEKAALIVNPYFSDVSKDYVYKANIEVYGKTFGGLLIVKKIEESKHRVVFTTEMGNKLFDFSFENEVFTVNYILEELDKKMLINILRDDFLVFVQSPIQIENAYSKDNFHIFEAELNGKPHFYFFKNDQLLEVLRTKGSKEKVSFLFNDIERGLAKKIEITHHNIKLKINLKSIK
ncbi:hypothetical protein [Mangrovimonas sp. YM274]|uniref:hypothetical protein n=1 Tax=Mangrovimonas sp. YM274 TaxID=3070660 RepID=UPI0027DB0CB9|nr:hypothetical protein [Mangrovimonas sp. YM274]WMI69481.1 hypothetical protein RBH95_03725 [Mangrovimonas sp. YM274]